MKSIQFSRTGTPDVLHLADVPKPTAGAGELLIHNSFAGINFIDTYFRSGLYPCALPSSLGQEAAGTVVAVGAGVSAFAVGDRVAYLSARDSYAEFSTAAAARAVKVPASIALDTAAAALIQGLTAHTLVTRAYAVKRGDWVLVHAGAGGTGRLLIQMCKALGATVIATTSTDAKAQVASQAGADHVIVYTRESVCERVRALVAAGVNVVYDGVGKSTFEASLESLRRTGTMVSFGNASGAVGPVRLFDLTPKNLVLLRPTLFAYIETDEEFAFHVSKLLGMIEDGSVEIAVSRVYPLEEAAQAHRDLEGRKTTAKVVLGI